jgi:hypothetical protein
MESFIKLCKKLHSNEENLDGGEEKSVTSDILTETPKQ